MSPKGDACWYITVPFLFSASNSPKKQRPGGGLPLGTQQNPAETGLYYLQSRYYNPQWGRFISADSLLDSGNVLGLNLFAYCLNNPVKYSDHTGQYAGAAWFGTMWWLLPVDGPIPIGDIIYVLGGIIVTAVVFELSDDVTSDVVEDSTTGSGYKPPSPDDDEDEYYYKSEDNFAGRKRMGLSRGDAPRNNQKQNDQFEYVVKKSKVKPAKVRAFKDEITKGGYDVRELIEIANTYVYLVIFFTQGDRNQCKT